LPKNYFSNNNISDYNAFNRKEKTQNAEGLMEILQNIWQVGGGDLTAPEDAAIYPIIFVTFRGKNM
jgi:hypothetical protein